MKERQILFSAPMVCAIREDRKTQTRRIVLPQPDWLPEVHTTYPTDGGLFWPIGSLGQQCGLPLAKCPYGQPGDTLAVRETFFAYGRWETRYSSKKGRDEWHFIDMTVECDRAYQYAADDPDVPLTKNRGGVTPGWWKRPAIHMPRRASRIKLEVMGVRVERLRTIDWEDAIAEGIRDPRRAAWRVDPVEGCVARYRELWDGLNAARGHGWDTNPWVWVVEFRRIT